MDLYEHQKKILKEDRKKHGAYSDYLLAVGKVTRAIWEANGDWRPKWNYIYGEKRFIHWDYEGERCGVSAFAWSSPLIIPYIKDRETAEQIIKDYEPELKTIFNYQRDVIN